jgi:transposase-like protein
MKRKRPALFKGRQFEAEIIVVCLRWYVSCMALRATKADENALYGCCICQNTVGASGLRSLPQWSG